MDDQVKNESAGQEPALSRAQEIIGLPVIEIETGNTLGQVKDVIYRRDGTVSGFLIADGDGREGLLPFAAAAGVGSGAVTIKGTAPVLEPVPAASEGEAEGAASSAGAKVITAGGDELGAVKDIALDLAAGRVAGIELSDGLIRDVIDGRAVIPPDGIVTWGEQVLIVDNRFAGVWNQEEPEEKSLEGGGDDGLSGM